MHTEIEKPKPLLKPPFRSWGLKFRVSNTNEDRGVGPVV
jgi:hypothetical protein